MRVAAIQTTATPDRSANLAAAGELVSRAVGDGAQLAVLPESFSVAGSPSVLRAGAEGLDGPTTSWAREIARHHRIWLLAGSFPEAAAEDGGNRSEPRIHNTSCLIDPTGQIVATYRKVHLFDVTVAGAASCESATVAPGTELVTAPLTGRLEGLEGTVGLSICYDLRFPELYRILTLRGATVVVVPAAFTAATGPPHWELLLRARAVENQIFVIAAGQVGTLPPGMPRGHGHSMVVDPWGTVLAERTDPTPGVVTADLDAELQRRVRTELPVLANRRPEAYVWPDGNRTRQGEHRQ
jgi:predicted amidohydrolase